MDSCIVFGTTKSIGKMFKSMLTEKNSILFEGDIGGKYIYFAEHKPLGLKSVLQNVI